MRSIVVSSVIASVMSINLGHYEGVNIGSLKGFDPSIPQVIEITIKSEDKLDVTWISETMYGNSVRSNCKDVNYTEAENELTIPQDGDTCIQQLGKDLKFEGEPIVMPIIYGKLSLKTDNGSIDFEFNYVGPLDASEPIVEVSKAPESTTSFTPTSEDYASSVARELIEFLESHPELHMALDSKLISGTSISHPRLYLNAHEEQMGWKKLIEDSQDHDSDNGF